MDNTSRFIIALILLVAGPACRLPADGPFTDVMSIRELAREEAASALPVKLRGVVVYQGRDALVLHDGEASVYLDFRFSQAQGVWKGSPPNLKKIKPGTDLEIGGVTDPGGFSPMVLVESFKPVGRQPIPEPIRPGLRQLLSGSLNSQWIEVEGVVRKLDNDPERQQCLTLQVGGHPCPVLLHERLDYSEEQLVDAVVRVRGVFLDIANLRSQQAGMKIHSNGKQDVEVLVPPPPNPFLAQRVPLDKLLTFRPDGQLGHRRVSSGLVLFAVPGRFFYLMDHGISVRVDSSEAHVAPGEQVEVSGFINNSSGVLASFSEALVRKIGQGTVPPPREPMISEILNPRTRSSTEMIAESGNSDFDGSVIRLEGLLRRVLPPDGEGNTILVIESDEHLVRAILPAEAPDWIEGSVVELTGVCELEMDRIDRAPWFSISGFHLWLFSPDDLRVISEPAWWTARRLAMLLVAVVVFLGIALAWGYTMQRQVLVRGARLAEEIAARESSRLEFETVLRERQRLATDLHDTLEQNLTGLALQLEIADRSSSSDPGLSKRHLKLARQFLERSRSEAHRAVWDLRSSGQNDREFLDILRERVSAMVAGTGINIRLDCEGGPVPLPDLIAGNLLLLAQEAVTNALKHSGASEIFILLRLSSMQVELEITDNGRGFDPSKAPGLHEGHFGIQGMRERSKRLGGKIKLTTSPGNGTLIQVEIPLHPQGERNP